MSWGPSSASDGAACPVTEGAMSLDVGQRHVRRAMSGTGGDIADAPVLVSEQAGTDNASSVSPAPGNLTCAGNSWSCRSCHRRDTSVNTQVTDHPIASSQRRTDGGGATAGVFVDDSAALTGHRAACQNPSGTRPRPSAAARKALTECRANCAVRHRLVLSDRCQRQGCSPELTDAGLRLTAPLPAGGTATTRPPPKGQ